MHSARLGKYFYKGDNTTVCCTLQAERVLLYVLGFRFQVDQPTAKLLQFATKYKLDSFYKVTLPNGPKLSQVCASHSVKYCCDAWRRTCWLSCDTLTKRLVVHKPSGPAVLMLTRALHPCNLVDRPCAPAAAGGQLPERHVGDDAEPAAPGQLPGGRRAVLRHQDHEDRGAAAGGRQVLVRSIPLPCVHKALPEPCHGQPVAGTWRRGLP